jgi:hypothetical protein
MDVAYGAEVSAYAPLPWKGLQVHGSYMLRLGETSNLKPPQIYQDYRFNTGLQTLAMTYTHWLAPGVLGSVSAGQLKEDYRGVQGQAVWLPTGGELAGSQLRANASVLNVSGTSSSLLAAPKDIRAYEVAYRWNHATTGLYADVAMHRYADGDNGPSIAVGRWFGDVAAQLNYRRSNNGLAFVGVNLSVPLGPRQGMARRGPVSLDAVPAFDLGISTMLATPGQCNCIGNTSATVIKPAVDLGRDWLNQGRASADYLSTHVHRMRDAWWQLGEGAGYR